jgi:hypothetical protein
MLDKELTTLLGQKINFEIGAQLPPLRQGVEQIKREMNARGVLQSGMTVHNVGELCNDSISPKAEIISQTIINILQDAEVEYSDYLGGQLKEIASKHLPEGMGDLEGYVKQVGRLTGISTLDSIYNRFKEKFRITRDVNLRRIHNNIDLLMVKLKKIAETTQEDKSTVFNINAPVGAIQTGDKSTANITQNIDSATSELLSKALRIIEKAIIKEEATEFPKEEVLEIIRESHDELTKKKPNITKLKSFFLTVSTSIQSIASLKTAYEILKPAFGILGIPLP